MRKLDISTSEECLTGEKRLEGTLVLDPPDGWIQQRYVLAFLAFLGNTCGYTLRVNLSVAIVAMVNQTAVAQTNVPDFVDECPVPLEGNETVAYSEGEFFWSQYTQGIILSSFFWGYIVTQVPGGWLAQRWSGKWVYGVGILLTGLLTLVTPIATRADVSWLIVIRFLEGMAEGLIFPSLQVLLTKWSPPLERTQITTLAMIGIQAGSFIGLLITGYICGNEWTGGWPTSFYFFGTITTMWFILWSFLIADTPQESRWITDEEKLYIQKSLGTTARFEEESEQRVPWVDILTSVPVWANIAAYFANNWGFYTILTSLPQYMNDVLHFNITQNGFLMALPYLAFMIWAVPTSFLADWCRRREFLSTTAVRKIGNFLANLLPGLFLLSAGWMGCDRGLAVMCVILSVMFSAFGVCSIYVNYVDLTPRYVGVLVGITNLGATVPGIMAPYVVGELTNAQPTRGQWQIVFYITFGIYAFAALFYSLFGSGLKQSWNDHGERTDRLERRFSNYGSVESSSDEEKSDNR